MDSTEDPSSEGHNEEIINKNSTSMTSNSEKQPEVVLEVNRAQDFVQEKPPPPFPKGLERPRKSNSLESSWKF